MKLTKDLNNVENKPKTRIAPSSIKQWISDTRNHCNQAMSFGHTIALRAFGVSITGAATFPRLESWLFYRALHEFLSCDLSQWSRKSLEPRTCDLSVVKPTYDRPT